MHSILFHVAKGDAQGKYRENLGIVSNWFRFEAILKHIKPTKEIIRMVSRNNTKEREIEGTLTKLSFPFKAVLGNTGGIRKIFYTVWIPCLKRPWKDMAPDTFKPFKTRPLKRALGPALCIYIYTQREREGSYPFFKAISKEALRGRYRNL